MNSDYFKGKTITVFGLGILGGGLGVVKFLAKNGAKKIIVTDIKSKQELKQSVEKLKKIENIEFILGYHRSEDFTEVDLIIKNPGIPWDNKYIKQASSKKIPIEMDSSLFFKLCQNPIIGVTGTKGKTTTSSMIFDILKNSGEKPLMVGVGQESVLDKLKKLKKNSIVIFELSSWRLSALGRAKLSPKIAVFKNFFPDHLNYYKTLEEYFRDKQNIFLHQKPTDWLIINADDKNLQTIYPKVKSQILEFSLEKRNENRSVYCHDGDIYINNGIDNQKLVSIEKINIYGKHNLTNVLASIGAVYSFGIKFSKIKKAVKKISTVEHRLEFIKEFKQIKYFNDTSATVPEASIVAIEAFKEPIVLIAGGADKELDFAELGKIIAEKVKCLVLLKGNATDKLIKQIRKNLPADSHDSFCVVESMAKAVEMATRCADAGDVVLLSPGAASFGIFVNEFDRGQKFREAVKLITK